MNVVRLGAVEYLNARPLVHGLTAAALRAPVRRARPAARPAARGRIDVGLIPSIEYLRGSAKYAIVPDIAIASRGPVASVAIYTTKAIARCPIDRARHQLEDLGRAGAGPLRTRLSHRAGTPAAAPRSRAHAADATPR